MAEYKNHTVSNITKLLVVGDSGAGKTGLLATLANAGYKLRIFDFDNGLDILAAYLTEDGAKNVNYVTLNDPLTGQPKAWEEFKRVIGNGWKFGEEDLGRIETWGADEVLVIDSMTFMGEAAKHFVSAAARKPAYAQLEIQECGEAARLVENMIAYLNSAAVKCNVVVSSHVRYIEGDMGGIKAYPTSVGSTLCTKVASYFNTVVRADTKSGKDSRNRVLRTMSDNRMDLKTTAPNKIQLEEDFDLAKIFKAIKDNANKLHGDK